MKTQVGTINNMVLDISSTILYWVGHRHCPCCVAAAPGKMEGHCPCCVAAAPGKMEGHCPCCVAAAPGKMEGHCQSALILTFLACWLHALVCLLSRCAEPGVGVVVTLHQCADEYRHTAREEVSLEDATAKYRRKKLALDL